MTGAGSAGRPHALRVELGSLSELPIRVLKRPVLSAHALLMDTVGGGVRGTPQAVRSVLGAALGEAGHVAYSPLASRLSFYPDALIPDLGDSPDWMSQMAESIGDADPGEVVDQLLEHFGELPPARWQPVIARPKPWLDTIARALLGPAAILTALWAGTSARMDVELARLEKALADRAALPIYLNTLSPLVKLIDDHLLINYIRDIPIPLMGELALAPMIAPPRSYLLFDLDRDLCLGYPMADSASYLFAEPVPDSRHNQLSTLLGELRAQLLRGLDVPQTMGQLIQEMHCAASTASYHVTQLRNAGLVTTIVLGKHRWVARTAAGTKLLELLHD